MAVAHAFERHGIDDALDLFVLQIWLGTVRIADQLDRVELARCVFKGVCPTAIERLLIGVMLALKTFALDALLAFHFCHARGALRAPCLLFGKPGGVLCVSRLPAFAAVEFEQCVIA